MLFGSLEPHYAVAGFLIGALVGVTGVGGGSLMTPTLILLFGVTPATAVGTDLLFAATTKTVGAVVHGFNRTIAWHVVGRLALGSIPGAVLALSVLFLLHMHAGGARRLITFVLSTALVLAAIALIARGRVSTLYGSRLAGLNDRAIAGLTIGTGVIIGILVTISSVGAGAIGVSVLFLLYPKISMARIVGSDIAHAVPLTLIAGLGHGAMGSLDANILISLLVGSFPGIFLSSLVSSRVPDTALRYVLAAVLILVGGKLAIDAASNRASALTAVSEHGVSNQ